MLAQSAPLPRGSGWAFELKLDGFRALADTHDGFRVVSRRGWDMTERVPELRALPQGLTLDGELVAWGHDGWPSWPRLGQRILHGRGGIEISLFVFDVLRVEGHDAMCLSYAQRRVILEALELPSAVRLVDTYDPLPPQIAVVVLVVIGVILTQRVRLGREVQACTTPFAESGSASRRPQTLPQGHPKPRGRRGRRL